MRNKRNAKPQPTAAIAVDTVNDAPIVAIIDAPIVAPIVDAAIAPTMRRPLTFADYGVDAPSTMPAYMPAFIAGFRAVSAMPSTTRDERAACAAEFDRAVSAIIPDASAPVGRHTGRFTGMPVFESQNTLYVAAALSNVVVANGHIMAAWRVELPNAKCDYLAKSYAWTTLSEYINNHHNDARLTGALAVVTAWAGRNRQPVDVPTA